MRPVIDRDIGHAHDDSRRQRYVVAQRAEDRREIRYYENGDDAMRNRDGDQHDNRIAHRGLHPVAHFLVHAQVFVQALKRDIQRAGRFADFDEIDKQRREYLRVSPASDAASSRPDSRLAMTSTRASFSTSLCVVSISPFRPFSRGRPVRVIVCICRQNSTRSLVVGLSAADRAR